MQVFHRLIPLLAVALTWAAEAAEAPRPPWFDYDRSVPLNLQETGVERRGDVAIHSIAFSGRTAKEQVSAFLVEPPGPGPHAAVLFVHWLGETQTTNRTQFLDEAVGLAKFGVMSLLVDAQWAAAGWWEKRTHADDYPTSVRQVVELRRSMDLLLSRPGVDPKRFALVGHDFGAMYGVLAGAADPRPKTYVLLAATPRLSDWYLDLEPKKQPKDRDAYLRRLSPLDPDRWVARLAPASVLFQFAEVDRYVPKEKAQAFFAAAAEPKLLRFYNTNHGMGAKDGVNERFRWLARELGLKVN